MAPGVGCDLMAFGYHAFDDCYIFVGGVDGTFSEVVTGDHEGGFGAIGCKFVEKIISVEIWSVVKCKGNI